MKVRAGRARLRGAVAVALLICVSCAVVMWAPWHGPIILSLSETHGVDTGDLPALLLLAVAVAIGQANAQPGSRRTRWLTGRWALPAPALVLGAILLLPGVLEWTHVDPLVPAGGGTFGGRTEHADARRADPVNRWSHLAMTYDGAKIRLYVNGSHVSTRAITGTILRTTDPLWMGGNRPYGEYFHGLIDDVRIYDRALSASEVRAEMSTPIGSEGTALTAGLVGAYAFDSASRMVATDASGNGNTGTIMGASWTREGRFGGALQFDGASETVRIPASPSIDLRNAMTLSAWIRPSESQAGWRTILHRQTDAYFLTAGGGGTYARLRATNDARGIVFIGAIVWFCLMLSRASSRSVSGRRRWWWLAVALFLAGSVIDAWLAPSGTLVGPTLVAVWYAASASHRGEAMCAYLLAAALAGVTVVSLSGGLERARDHGGVARSVTLGLLFVTAGLLGALYGSQHTDAPGKALAQETPRFPS